MRAIAMLLVAALVSGPMVTAARASTSAGWSTNEIPGLKRTKQVLSTVIALLKLIDEIRALPDPGGPAVTMPPPIGTGHPGPLPGPLPIRMPAGEETS